MVSSCQARLILLALLLYRNGDALQSYLKILSTLEEGAFGKVIKEMDLFRNDIVALKIVKIVKKYRETAKPVISILEKVAKYDPRDKYRCVHMLGSFDYHGHMRFTLIMLCSRAFDFLRSNDYKPNPYPIHQVHQITFNRCYTVKNKRNTQFLHTDLKPVTSMKGTSVIYDVLKFVSLTLTLPPSITSTEDPDTVTSSRRYRAVEVTIELDWLQPCVVWSVSCIMFQLALGFTVFQTHDNREHLAMLERFLGLVPMRIALKTGCFSEGKLYCTNGRHARKNWIKLVKVKGVEGAHPILHGTDPSVARTSRKRPSSP